MDEVFQLLDYLGIQSQSTIQTYARLAQRRHLKKGECLYYGGEDSTNLYFLISGILRGFTVSAGGKEYTECILHKYGHAHIGMIGMDMKLELEMQELKQVWYGLDGSAQTLDELAKILDKHQKTEKTWEGNGRDAQASHTSRARPFTPPPPEPRSSTPR